MSTIKSSDEHLTLNADGSSKDIKFQANGVEKASISSAGAFTSTTIDATKLTGDLPAISGANLTGVGVAGISSSADATAMTIDSSENVLIGTTSALALGDTAAGKMQLVSTGGNALRFNIGCGGASAEPRMDINTATTTTAAAGSINFTKTHNNTLTALSDVVQGELLGSISFSGVSRTNGSYNSGAFIKAFVSSTGTVGSTYVPTDLWLGTQDTSTNRASAPQLKIMSDGRGLSQFTAKAWVRVDMSTMGAPDSHNISSITDVATGHARCNFSNAMANSSYNISTSAVAGYIAGHSNINTTSFYLRAGDSNWSQADPDYCMALVFGD